MLALAAYLYWVSVMRLHPAPHSYVVEPGTTLRQFSNEMYHEKVLPDPYSLLILAKLQHRTHALKAGEYRFRDGITALELLDQVVSGRVVEYPLAIIEGWNFRQMMQAVDNAPRLEHTLRGLNAAAIMKRLGFPGEPPEGRFFPDTYYYSRGTNDVAILRKAYERMQKLLDDNWANRDPNLPLKSPYEALILASIVEKETARPEERRMIAGVFVNRLRRGMRLQTDPTVIYAMGTKYHGNIRARDLRIASPYNTYRHYGLPPTPIAMPGAASIEAVMHPEDTDALYFVSRGNGTHVFSKTLEEHDRAVIEYQLGGRAPRRQP